MITLTATIANLSVTLKKYSQQHRISSQKENSHLNASLSESNFLPAMRFKRERFFTRYRPCKGGALRT